MSNFNIEDTLGYIVSKAHQAMLNQFSYLLKTNSLNVTVEQWAVLNIAFTLPGISQSDIARMTQTDKANIMRMLDLLEKKNFINRKSDENDRRLHRIYLTRDGEEMLETILPLAEETNRMSATGLSPEELDELKKMLRKIRANTENVSYIRKKEKPSHGNYSERPPDS
jgi:MarR family transcriptional regulator, organic hydroperoxide resistance regulator